MSEEFHSVQNLVVFRDGMVLLGARRSPAFLPGTYAFPGGEINERKDQDAFKVAKEKLKREARLIATVYTLLGTVSEEKTVDGLQRHVHLIGVKLPKLLAPISSECFDQSPIAFDIPNTEKMGSWQIVSVHNLIREVSEGKPGINLYPTTRLLLLNLSSQILDFCNTDLPQQTEAILRPSKAIYLINQLLHKFKKVL